MQKIFAKKEITFLPSWPWNTLWQKHLINQPPNWAWGENSTFKSSFDLENVRLREEWRVEFQNAISIQSHHLSYRIIKLRSFSFKSQLNLVWNVISHFSDSRIIYLDEIIKSRQNVKIENDSLHKCSEKSREKIWKYKINKCLKDAISITEFVDWVISHIFCCYYVLLSHINLYI